MISANRAATLRADVPRSTAPSSLPCLGPVTRTPQNPGELPITVLSEIAHLALESGEAKFSKVVITDPMGRVLRAGDAEYRESEQVITAKGPMSFVADGFKVTGTNSSVNLESGQLLIAGPIEGSFTPKRRRP